MTVDLISNEQRAYTVWIVQIKESPSSGSRQRQVARNSITFVRRMCNLKFITFLFLAFPIQRVQITVEHRQLQLPNTIVLPLSLQYKISDNRNLQKGFLWLTVWGTDRGDGTSMKTET